MTRLTSLSTVQSPVTTSRDVRPVRSRALSQPARPQQGEQDQARGYSVRPQQYPAGNTGMVDSELDLLLDVGQSPV